MNTTKEASIVLNGILEGKNIQRRISDLVEWEDVNIKDNLCYLPDFVNFFYRVKPEPREFWMKLSSSGMPYDSCTASVKMTADHGHELIKVREVIEDNIDNDSYEVTNKMKGIGG